jgi:hypothetical protein
VTDVRAHGLRKILKTEDSLAQREREIRTRGNHESFERSKRCPEIASGSEVIEADLVVIGIGVRPLIDLAEQADIGHVDERVTLYCKTLPHYPQSFIRSGFSNPHLPQRMVALLSLRSDA